MLQVRTEGSPILLELSDWQTVTNENINKARVSYSCKWLSVHEKFHVQFARNKGDFFKVISWAHHGFKEILLSVWPFLELLLQIRILNVKFLLEFILRYIVSPILFLWSLEGIVSKWLDRAGGYYDVLLLHTLPYCEQSQYLIKKDDKSWKEIQQSKLTDILN